MSGYIGPSPVPQSIQRRQTFTATAAQTTFGTSGYTDGDFIDVYLNGVKLVGGTDYTATNGSDVVLTTGAAAGDILDFVTFNSFQLNAPSFDNSLTLQNATEEDTDGGRESTIIFKGEQSGGEISTLAEIEASHDGTADDEKGDLIFRTNDGADGSAPTERLRIDSAGNVGINESAPSGSLHVKGTSSSHSKVILEAGGSGGSSNNNFIEFNKYDGTKLAEIEVGETVVDGGDIVFKTTPAGGSATTRLRIRHDGGICFGSDNAAANALDDYEEGTYTPTISTASGSVTLDTNNDLLAYTKIGNQVTITGRLHLSSVSGPSGNTTVSLPFTSSNIGEGSSRAAFHFLTYDFDLPTGTVQTFAENAPGTNTVLLIYTVDNSGWGAINGGGFKSSTFFYINGTYFVD